MTYRAFGDSITAGQSAASGRGYVNLLAQALGVTIQNNGVSGHCAADQAAAIYASSIAAGDVSTYMIGTNEQMKYGTDAAKRGAFKNALLAELAWLAMPNKTTARDAAVTYAGSWGDTPVNSVGKWSWTNGDTASFDIEGDAAFLGFLVHDTQYSTADIYVDGVKKTTFNGHAPGVTTKIPTTQYAPALVALTGLGTGAHNIEIVITSATGSPNKLFFDWFAAPNAGATVVMGSLNRLTASGYATYGGSDENTLDYMTTTKEAAEVLQAFGLDIRFIDNIGTLIPANDLVSDGVHPNSVGHYKLAQKFRPLMQP
jgi:lysophospholipase L1-like esterase